MHILKPLSAMLLMATSHLAFADITLNIPSDIRLLAVNMEDPETSSSLFSSSETISLADGKNQIVFRYEPTFEENNERVDVSSDVYIATFETANTTLNFSLPEYMDEQEANQSIRNMQWSLVNEDGKKIDVASDKLKKNGMQLGRDYVRESEKYNRKGGIAAIGVVTTVLTMPKTQVVSTNNSQADQSQNSTTVEDMLHFWYNKADAATKAKFKAFVNQ